MRSTNIKRKKRKGAINTTVTISDLLIKNKTKSHFLNEQKFVWF